MKENKTLRGQNHNRFKTQWTKWYTKGGAQKLPPNHDHKQLSSKIDKEKQT